MHQKDWHNHTFVLDLGFSLLEAPYLVFSAQVPNYGMVNFLNKMYDIHLERHENLMVPMTAVTSPKNKVKLPPEIDCEFYDYVDLHHKVLYVLMSPKSDSLPHDSGLSSYTQYLFICGDLAEEFINKIYYDINAFGTESVDICDYRANERMAYRKAFVKEHFLVCSKVEVEIQMFSDDQYILKKHKSQGTKDKAETSRSIYEMACGICKYFSDKVAQSMLTRASLFYKDNAPVNTSAEESKKDLHNSDKNSNFVSSNKRVFQL